MNKTVDMLIATFTQELQDTIESEIRERVEAVVQSAFGRKEIQRKQVSTAKRSYTASPERRKAMQRQGKYLALLKTMSSKLRERVKKVAQKDGVPKALQLAQSLAKKPTKSKPSKKSNKKASPKKTKQVKKSAPKASPKKEKTAPAEAK